MDLLEQDVGRILLSLGPLPPSRPRPALVVVSGLPGSGKSTVTHALAQQLDIAVLQSDRLRKLLIARPRYTPAESARLFGAVHEALERLLRIGVPALLDATTLEERHRRPLAAIAARTGARLVLVWVEASVQEIRRRLAGRAAGARAPHDLSDADVAVYELLRARAEPIQGEHLVINTEQDIVPAIRALARLIEGHDPLPPTRGRGEGELKKI